MKLRAKILKSEILALWPNLSHPARHSCDPKKLQAHCQPTCQHKESHFWAHAAFAHVLAPTIAPKRREKEEHSKF
jgi:hypothetical protein